MRDQEVLESEITSLCNLIGKITGVQLGDKQRSMVVSRLKRRAIDLGLKRFEDYFDYFRKNEKVETDALVSLLTTHHTYFFREFSHFQYLEKAGLIQIVEAARARNQKKIKIWCAACSRGQEVYSLSMFLNYHLPKIAPDFTYEIFGTDVDAESVAIAQNGVYRRDEIKSAPMHYIADHWVRGTGAISEFVKAKPSIKSHCRFSTSNLLNFTKEVAGEKFDVIFCRNVFIYFTSEQIKDISLRMIPHLHDSGLLFIGISESLSGLDLKLRSLAPSVYALASVKTPKPVETVRQLTQQKAPALPSKSVEQVLRVVCVDDSPSVLTLLKKILTPEQGFKVVGTALNGLEATTLLRTVQADVMTLDIHMPDQDGVNYLKTNFSPHHPPVVIISSVSRDDAGLAMSCLNSGASDYVEKPVLSNLDQRGEEIRMKLKCAFRSKADASPRSMSLDQSFATKPMIEDPANCLRIVMMTMSDTAKVTTMLREFSGAQPPTVIVLEGVGHTLTPFLAQLSKGVNSPIVELSDLPASLTPGQVYGADAKDLERIGIKFSGLRTSVLIFGEASKSACEKIKLFKKRNVIAEDATSGERSKFVKDVADDLTPATSFAYQSSYFLAKKVG